MCCIIYTILLYILGPVRGIHFHDVQPLFVSGGDDYKIKVILLFKVFAILSARTTVCDFDNFVPLGLEL